MSKFTGRLLGFYEPGSDEWHKARAGRIGASEIGVICNMSPFQTSADLLAEKLGEQERNGNRAMSRGHYLEPAVADWFADHAGANYEPAGTYVHAEFDHHLANPDRICTDGSLLEIKTAKEKTVEHGWGRAGTDQIPISYAAQVQWQMHVTGLRLCHVAVLFGAPFDFYAYKVKYDPAVAAYLVRAANRFHAQLTRAEETAA
jgi:putative phage-type endonuclease